MRAAVAILVAIALGGCAAAADTTSRAPAALERAQATHEYPWRKPPAESVAGGAPTATAAVAQFASAYINWTATTVAADMLSLAAASIDQARSAMTLAAAQTASDYELQRAGIANSGAVEAVSPMAGGGGRYVVVTRESTTATNTSAYQGLAPAWHVALATVVEVAAGRWVVSAWQPES